MADILVAVASAIFIAAVSSLITVQLSLRKFRTEKWWERKAGAYTEIIEVLHDSKEFSDQHLDAEQRGNEISEELDEELRANAKIANAEIRRMASVGAFLLSDEALARLAQFRKDENEASNTTSWYEHLERDWQATSTCLNDIIDIAKKDLKV